MGVGARCKLLGTHSSFRAEWPGITVDVDIMTGNRAIAITINILKQYITKGIRKSCFVE